MQYEMKMHLFLFTQKFQDHDSRALNQMQTPIKCGTLRNYTTGIPINYSQALITHRYQADWGFLGCRDSVSLSISSSFLTVHGDIQTGMKTPNWELAKF